MLPADLQTYPNTIKYLSALFICVFYRKPIWRINSAHTPRLCALNVFRLAVLHRHSQIYCKNIRGGEMRVSFMSVAS